MADRSVDHEDQLETNSPRENAMQATLEAGKELLRERGPAITLTNVPLEEAINLAGSPRASVYRAWQGYGEGGSARDNFHEALACYLLEEELAGGPQAVDILEQQLDAFFEAYPPERLGSMPVEERQELLRMTIATLGILAVQATDSKNWHARIAVAAAIACQPDQISPRLKDAYLRGEHEASERYLPIYRKISAHFGMRIKDAYTLNHFASAVLGLAEGTRARELFLSSHAPPLDDTWGLFNTSVVGLVREYFEADPEHPHPTVLA